MIGKVCKIGVVFLTLTVVLLCSTEQAESKEKSVTFGVSMNNLATEYTANLAQAIEDYGKELGIKIIMTDGAGNPNTQTQQIENFIVQQVDAVILQPIEAEAMSPAVEKCVAEGVPIINVNSVTIAEPTAFVGSDDVDAGVMAMEYIAERLNNSGNVVMMHGHLGQSAEIKRTEGANKVFAGTGLKLIAEQTASWNRDTALTLMQNWIEAYKGEINAVFAQNDEMAMGALLALEEAGIKEDIVLVGVDAIADALQAVKDDRLDATVLQDAKGQGVGAIDAALKILHGESVAKEVFIPFTLITSENVDEYLK